MKRLFSLCLLGLVLLPGVARAAQTFTNDTTTVYYYNSGTELDSPPIDAINFVNNGTFIASNATPFLSSFVFATLPFETSETQNYTNNGTMIGSVGFRFRNNPASVGLPTLSRNFVNDLNASIDGFTYLVVQATNVVNRGILSIGSAGLMDLTAAGKMDLAESQLLVPALSGNDFGFFGSGSFTINTNFFVPDQGIYDVYWGATNINFGTSFDALDLWAPVQLDADSNIVNVATAADMGGRGANNGFFQSFISSGFSIPVFGSNYVTSTNSVIGTNLFTGFPFFADTNRMSATNLIADSQVSVLASTTVTVTNFNLTQSAFSVPSNVVKQAVFVCVPDGFTAQIGFQGFGGLNTAAVLISTTTTNSISAVSETNTIYFQDTLASETNRGLYQNYFYSGYYRPANYLIQRAPYLFGFFGSGVGNPGNAGYPSTNFFLSTGSTNGIGSETPSTTFITNGAYSVYAANIDNVDTRPANIPGATFTNFPGRIMLTATNLDLTDTIISAQGLISIKAGHLISSTNAVIDCDSLSFDIGSTNGSLVVRDLAPTSVTGRLKGTIRAWSALWTNTVDMVITNNYTDTGTGVVPAPFTVTATVVYHALILDGSSLSSSLPTYVYDLVTHASSVTVQDSMNVVEKLVFDAKRVTLEGNLTLVGSFPTNPATGLPAPGKAVTSWTKETAPTLLYFTNIGALSIPSGAQFGGGYGDAHRPQYYTFVNGGSISAGSIGVDSWYLENHGNLDSRGVLDLKFGSAFLTNGVSTSSNIITFTGNNLLLSNYQLTSGSRIDLNVGSILTDFGTTNLITTLNGINLLVKPISGDLLGTIVTDFAPKMGVSTILHTWAGENRGATVEGFINNGAIGRLELAAASSGAKFKFTGAGSENAMYVDELDFGSFLANADAEGNMTNVIISSNMRIYYAEAVADGVSIAEKLDGKNGGRFVWVPSYAGTYSGIDLDYSGTTYRFNRALVQSSFIDSNSNGSPNSIDPMPIPEEFAFTPVENYPVFPTLPFPAEGGSGSSGFSGAKGTYNGLFYSLDGVAPETSGYFSAKTTDSGRFSAKVQWAGRSYSFSGQFDASGRATNDIPRSPLVAELQLDLNGANQITGWITDGEWMAKLLADRAVFNKKTNPAIQAGKYTVIIPGISGDPGIPAGSGFGTLSVDANGNVKWNGTLADGTKVSQKSAISGQGVWPMYSSLYNGGGVLLGWIHFEDQIETDVQGQALWLKSDIGGNYYPFGFVAETALLGARYTTPPNLTNGVAVFAEGNLTESLTNTFTLDKGYKISKQGDNELTLSINQSTGLFKGSVLDLDGGTLFFEGALLKKTGQGAGFFLGPDQSGAVYLNPLP